MALRLLVVALLVAALVALAPEVGGSSRGAPGPVHGWWPDGGGGPALRGPFELAIEWVSDCGVEAPGVAPPQCGPPPALWPAARRPIEVCTLQGSRPAWWTAEQFRQAVQAAADDWNALEAAIGIRYSGDCASQARFERTRDNRNTVAFDDERALLAGAGSGRALAVTYPWWSVPSGGTRTILEADILMGASDALQACPAVVLRHEFGHALGFGHSDQPADLMTGAPPPPIQVCNRQPSPAEVALLQSLYGVDRRPTVTVANRRTARAQESVTLSAQGVDPEGQPLTYAWVQLRGQPVVLAPSGPNVSFVMPATVTGDLEFQVVVTDPHLHRAIANVLVQPTTAPGGRVVGGSAPLSGGFGLIIFSGGSENELLAATCGPAAMASSAFWATDAGGRFVVFIPGTAVPEVNAGWRALFPSGIPDNSALMLKCV